MLDAAAYRSLLARATAATTVRELYAMAREARETYPDDPAVDVFDSSCFLLAAGLLERCGAAVAAPADVPAPRASVTLADRAERAAPAPRATWPLGPADRTRRPAYARA